MLRWILRRILGWWFGLRVYNESVLGTPGPVLLVPNHVSWLDWLFVGVCLDRDWRFVVSSVAARTSWLHRRIMMNRRTFPVDPTSPYGVRRMAEHLAKDGRLVLFAEGRISRTGCLMKLFDGTGFLLHKTRARVITCHLRGAERVLCSPHPGWRRVFPVVSVHFSDLLTPPGQAHVPVSEARSRLTGWLRDRMVCQQFQVETEFGPRTLPEAVWEMARRQPRRVVLQDATMKTLSYRRLLVAVDVLARVWQRELPEETVRVGVLLPNVNAMGLVLLGLWRQGRQAAILNYSTGMATMLACARLSGLRTVITSRVFLERLKLGGASFEAAGVRLLYLEDMRVAIGRWSKLSGVLRSLFRPRQVLLGPSTSSDTAVLLYTSGSEGMPKGVELTHGNLMANIRQMLAVVDVMDTDRFFSALPLFHSFGLLAGLLVPLVRGVFSFLYPSPLHYRLIPAVFYSLDCTVMFGTNTFLNGYGRKAHPYDFRSLRYLVAGAEKLQDNTVELWCRKFGVRPIEGYGATECSPAICVNTCLDNRVGSVGRLLPGMECRFEPVAGVHEGGRLLVRGPNVMRGYVNAEADAEFKVLGGWYDTGDLARMDGDGFVYLLGRLKRFAKVSGEMVSLTAVEEVLAGAFPQFGLRCEVVVVSRPDDDKGEVLLAVTNEPRLRQEQVREIIRQRGLTNLCVPRELRLVREIPKLGTGKTDYRELERVLAASRGRVSGQEPPGSVGDARLRP
jgi:acyl-[acyl-carrier-protein]-phospholipid O-acyltransferase/long-chain-fatty-acid--[acyl-carrier-protein] ligase